MATRASELPVAERRPAERPTSMFDDPALPAQDLLGDGAPDLLAAALDAVGARLDASRPTQSTYHPGRSLRVCHEVDVRWADGTGTRETMVLAAGRTPPAGAFVVGDGTHDVAVWRVPHDPWLPGLAAVVDPGRRLLLGGLGLPLDVDPADLTCHLRAYRPGRRAVVEVVAPGARVFVKVVRPDKAAELRDRHEALADAVPAPPVLGWSPDHGIVVLQALDGHLLRDVLTDAEHRPSPDTVLALLDALPALDLDPAVAPTPDWRAVEFAGIIGAVAPALADRVDTFAAGIGDYERRAAAEPVVAVHGDFYEAQLLVDHGAIHGLLDVDTFGTGRRVDDLATLIGHLSVLALDAPDRPGIEAYAAELLHRFDRDIEPGLLRAAVAGVVLGLATGSFRERDDGWEIHTERRVALAEAWLASADAASCAAAFGADPTSATSSSESSGE